MSVVVIRSHGFAPEAGCYTYGIILSNQTYASRIQTHGNKIITLFNVVDDDKFPESLDKKVLRRLRIKMRADIIRELDKCYTPYMNGNPRNGMYIIDNLEEFITILEMYVETYDYQGAMEALGIEIQPIIQPPTPSSTQDENEPANKKQKIADVN